MPGQKLRNYLDQNDIKYVHIRHSPAYTTQEIAASAHISGWDMAKIVMLKMDGEMVMAVLPASERIDLDHLREVTGAKKLELATEEEFEVRFPDCELGAMPPFGNLYDLDVYVAEDLARDEQIAFNAGTHTELMRLAYQDFERLVKPRVLSFATLTPA